MTGSYNNFFRMFDRNLKKEVTYEASREIAKPKTLLKPRKVSTVPPLPSTFPVVNTALYTLSMGDKGWSDKG